MWRSRCRYPKPLDSPQNLPFTDTICFGDSTTLLFPLKRFHEIRVCRAKVWLESYRGAKFGNSVAVLTLYNNTTAYFSELPYLVLLIFRAVGSRVKPLRHVGDWEAPAAP